MRALVIRRALTPAVAVALLGGLLAVVPATPAAAASAITVTPSTNLVQGQTVSVSGTGYPANSTVGIIECGAGAQTAFDCELRYTTAPTDASGAFSNASFVVNQVISSGNLGTLNCAVDSCIIAVGTLDQQNIAVQPITMTNTLGPPDATATLDARFVVDAGWQSHSLRRRRVQRHQGCRPALHRHARGRARTPVGSPFPALRGRPSMRSATTWVPGTRRAR